MNYKTPLIAAICFFIFCKKGTCQGSDSYAFKFNKFEISASLFLKKNTPYSQKITENTLNKFNLKTDLSSQLELLIGYDLSNKIKLYSGIGIAGNTFAGEIQIIDPEFNFNYGGEVRINSIKIPVRVGYRVNKYFELLGGFSINFNENTSNSIPIEYVTDSLRIESKLPLADKFPKFNSISANLGLNIYLGKRFRLFALYDIDFYVYPPLLINTSVTQNNIKTNYNFNAQSKFYFISGGITLLIFKPKK